MSFHAIAADGYDSDEAYKKYFDSSADVQRTEDADMDEDDGEEVEMSTDLVNEDQFSIFFKTAPLPDDDVLGMKTWGCRKSYEQAYLSLKRAFERVDVDIYLDDIFVKVKWDENKKNFQRYYSYRGLPYKSYSDAKTIEVALQMQILWYRQDIRENRSLGHVVEETGFMSLGSAKRIMIDGKPWTEAWFGKRLSTQKNVGKKDPRFFYPRGYDYSDQMEEIRKEEKKQWESDRRAYVKDTLKSELRGMTVNKLKNLESNLTKEFFVETNKITYQKDTTGRTKQALLDRLETFVDKLDLSDLQKLRQLIPEN